MKIRGILDNSLNGQLCIRGFAPIKELARISKADYTYQRNPIDRTDISDFLEYETYLFFPEIILGYKFKHKISKTKDTSVTKETPLLPLESIQAGKKFKSNVDNTIVSIKISDYKASNDVASKDKIVIAEIDFDDAILNQLIIDEKPPLSRIDGNHRLLAAEQSESPKVNRMLAPFCILLGEDLYDSDGNMPSKLSEFDKSTIVYFHNINTKTIPLTSEENLKVLIDRNEYFSDTELKDILGEEGVLTRNLIDRYNCNDFTEIQHIIGGNHRSCYLEIFRSLDSESKDVEKVLEALKSIDRFYGENQKLKANSNFGMFYAFLHYWIQDKDGKFNLFKKWVINNHLFETKDVTAIEIIKIFDKIAEQEIKVFVAMPYFEGDSEIVADYNNIYQSAIDEIREKHGVKISLFEIMNNKGATQDQIQDIINKIKQCTIFIADISGNNANVLYETGWARALDKHVLLFREEKSDKPKSDYSNDTYHIYKDSARSTSLKKIAIDNIVEILSKNFGLITQ